MNKTELLVSVISSFFHSSEKGFDALIYKDKVVCDN